MFVTARVPFGSVIHPGDIGVNCCGQVAGHGVPRGLVHWPRHSVVAASGTVLVWNLSHEVKLNLFRVLVEGLHVRRQQPLRKTRESQRSNSSFRFPSTISQSFVDSSASESLLLLPCVMVTWVPSGFSSSRYSTV